MTCTGQGATGLRHQWKDVAGADDVFSLGVFGSSGLHSTGTISRRNAGGHTGGGLNRDCEFGAKAGAIARRLTRHQNQLTSLFKCHIGSTLNEIVASACGNRRQGAR